MSETDRRDARPTGRGPFAPLTPEMLAEAAARRLAGEAEIARKEAALAEAEARLAETRARETELEAELDSAGEGGD